jgi:hypothetical protein
MARTGWVIGFALVVAGMTATAEAAEPCAEGRGRTGMVVRIADEGVVVESVDPGSAAERQGIRPGDRVLQINDVRPTSCRSYSRAVRRAEEDALALLWLVERGGQRIALALDVAPGAPLIAGAPPPTVPAGAAPAAGEREGTAPPPLVATAPTAPPPPPTTSTSLPTAEPLPEDVPVSLDGVLAALGGLSVQTRRGLPVYQEAVGEVARQVATLRVREGASPAVLTGLDQVLRLHEGAVVAWAAVEDLRQRKGIRSRMPLADNAAADFFTDSDVERLLDRYDFLADTVTREPGDGFIQVAGRWQPVRARTLLWEHAGSALGQVTAQLADEPAE